MAAEMSTSEVLNKAADLIEECGWTAGDAGWDWQEDGSAPLCLEGGILAALGVRSNAVGWLTSKLRACPSYVAVHQYLAESGDIDHNEYLWEFNDNSAEERVIGVLRATALIESARERESVEV